MKTNQKHFGTGAGIRVRKKKERRIATTIFLSFILLMVVLPTYLMYNYLNQPQNQTTNQTSAQLRAAIVDQLSLTLPNQAFIETATNILEEAGYTVNYYPGEEVTVEFYRNLPTCDCRIIILRVHSALVSAEKPPVTLFTSEPYSKTKYVYEQLTDQVGWVTYRFENGTPKEPTYFGISPLFVKQSMNGRFQNTIVVMMGCNGLTYTDLAEAFIEKGANVYIGWTAPVLASHTDLATSSLLKHLFIEKRTIKQAIESTYRDSGADPTYNSLLLGYPKEASDYTIKT
jgi:hypothetical protein